MRGLVFFVVGVADENAAQPVEGQLAIGFGVVDFSKLRRGLQVDMVGLAATQCPRRRTDAEFRKQPLLDTRHQGSDQHAFFEPEFEVARLVQLFVKPTGFKGFWIGAEFVVGASCGDGFKRSIGREHAGFDSGMAAFDAGSIQIARVATDQSTAGKYGFGQSLQCAVVDGTRAIADTLAAF